MDHASWLRTRGWLHRERAMHGGWPAPGFSIAAKPGSVPSSELLSCQAPDAVIGGHAAVDDGGQLTFEAADALAPCLTLGAPSVQVGLRTGIETDLHQGDGMQGPVEFAVAAAVEAMAAGVAR